MRVWHAVNSKGAINSLPKKALCSSRWKCTKLGNCHTRGLDVGASACLGQKPSQFALSIASRSADRVPFMTLLSGRVTTEVQNHSPGRLSSFADVSLHSLISFVPFASRLQDIAQEERHGRLIRFRQHSPLMCGAPGGRVAGEITGRMGRVIRFQSGLRWRG